MAGVGALLTAAAEVAGAAVGAMLAPGVTPSKFGQAVRILGDWELGSQPHLRFRSFEVQDSRARVVVDYRIEGVEALFVLENTASGWWKVVDVKVSEH